MTMIPKGSKAVKLKDFNNTIIIVDENIDSEKAAKKYMKDLKEYEYSNMKSLIKEQNFNKK